MTIITIIKQLSFFFSFYCFVSSPTYKLYPGSVKMFETKLKTTVRLAKTVGLKSR